MVLQPRKALNKQRNQHSGDLKSAAANSIVDPLRVASHELVPGVVYLPLLTRLRAVLRSSEVRCGRQLCITRVYRRRCLPPLTQKTAMPAQTTVLLHHDASTASPRERQAVRQWS